MRQPKLPRMMNTPAYLERIGAEASDTHPSLAALTRLQQAHLLAVPFENLDIHRSREITFAGRFAKVVTQRRGGFCYELNSLFAELLRALGYRVKLVAARVYSSSTQTYGPEFDHLALIVALGKEEYLVDVGFGEFTLHPLRLLPGLEQPDPRGRFRIEQLADQDLVVQKLTGETWTPEYRFSLTARELTEFEPMCRYHQTSPESHFTRKSLCSLLTPAGRITLTGHTLKITDHGSITEQTLPDEPAYHAALARYFGIRL
ncbi:arylamine N-acetyltransferase family protein [Hymenobacter lucidus]|uniref:Arylamine N-acetyltransferase n=1 Tax=Hymenobacter lucidus TaxID=2880930 RepID=A0ABS8AKX3_9BACT|nr:arylamine N-acetyltransferase [Hymenobacter lucidus]MCB2406857.1 arylamine N-acetyltransferase [Hymenobacter lucidus]